LVVGAFVDFSPSSRHINDQYIQVIVNRNAAAPNSLLAQPGQSSQ